MFTGSTELVVFYLIDIHYMVPYRAHKKMYYPVLSPELEVVFTKWWVLILQSYFIYTATTQNQKY